MLVIYFLFLFFHEIFKVGRTRAPTPVCVDTRGSRFEARWRNLYYMLPEPIYACHLAETPKGLGSRLGLGWVRSQGAPGVMDSTC